MSQTAPDSARWGMVHLAPLGCARERLKRDLKRRGTRDPIDRNGKKKEKICWLVSWCFKPSQLQKDYIRAEGDFHKNRYLVKGPIRAEGDFHKNRYLVKGPIRQK